MVYLLLSVCFFKMPGFITSIFLRPLYFATIEKGPKWSLIEICWIAGRQVMNYYLPWLLVDFFCGTGRNSNVSPISVLENSPKTGLTHLIASHSPGFPILFGGFPNLRCLTVWSRRILWKYMWVCSLNDHCSLFLREWDKLSN